MILGLLKISPDMQNYIFRIKYIKSTSKKLDLKSSDF